MDAHHSVEVFKHLEKQRELLMDAYRSLSHELHLFQVEEEMLMRKCYKVTSAEGLTKKLLNGGNIEYCFSFNQDKGAKYDKTQEH